MTQDDLRIRLLGLLQVESGTEQAALPPSKKARALLGYLIFTAREHRRQQLSKLLWDVADDPRGGLRWCLSKIRSVIDDPKTTRLVSSRDTVCLDLADADVDLYRVRTASAELSKLTSEALWTLTELFRGELLEDLDLPDFETYQAWLTAAREDCQQLRVAMLSEAVGRVAEDDPERALPFARDLARLCPRDVNRHLALFDLLERTGRHREAEQQVEVGRRALVERGFSDSPLVEAKRLILSKPYARTQSSRAKELRQEVRFCKSFDGTRIAYAKVGQGPPLVKAANWLSHLDYDWESPVWSHFFSGLCERNQLIRYDDRGNGLSDWDVEEISFDAFCKDLEHVVDAAGLDRFALLGLSKGASIAARYAAEHPERVSHLVLCGGFATGSLVDASEQRVEYEKAMRTLMRANWGADNPAYRQMFTSTFMPGATQEHMRWFNDLQKATTSPDNAIRLRTATSKIDVRPILPRIEAPTLVLHARGDAAVSYERGLGLAAAIPNARFVTLESDNHLLREDEPAWPKFLEELHSFLAE